MAIVKEVESQLNIINKAFPVMVKAWESKLPAINVYAISVAPRGEDRGKEVANLLTWESFIVVQENQNTDIQQQRAFINSLLYSKDDVKFIDIVNEDFGEEETPAWWRISGGAHAAPKPKPMPRPSAGSEQQGVPPSASSSSGTTGRAPWWTTTQQAGQERDDGLIGNQTIQAILEISAKGEDDRWVVPERHDAMNLTPSSSNALLSATSTLGLALSCARNPESSCPLRNLDQKSKRGRQHLTGNGFLWHLVTTLLIFDERRRADRTVAAYLNKPNLAWLQLYAYICAKTGCLYSAKLPGATALKALIDGHDNPDTANAAISKILKRYADEDNAPAIVQCRDSSQVLCGPRLATEAEDWEAHQDIPIPYA